MWSHYQLAGLMKYWRVFFCFPIDEGYQGKAFFFFLSGGITRISDHFYKQPRDRPCTERSGGEGGGRRGALGYRRASVLGPLMWSQQGRLFSGTSCLLPSRVEMSRPQANANFGESAADPSCLSGDGINTGTLKLQTLRDVANELCSCLRRCSENLRAYPYGQTMEPFAQ